VLDSEFEQFAKYFTQPAQLIVGPDSPTPEALDLLTPAAQYDHSFDLSEEKLSFVESFPYILTRRSPVTTRPPANYTLILGNRFYELWRRKATPVVYSHLPLGTWESRRPARTTCASLHAIVARSPRGAELALAVPPAAYGYRLIDAASRSPGWLPSGSPVEQFSTVTPGRAEQTVTVARSGSYELWIQGNLPRQVTITLDGRTIGAAQGNNTPDEWLDGGKAQIREGPRVLGVARPGGSLRPGDGSKLAAIGAVAVTAANQRAHLALLPLGHWRAACRASGEWIEVIGSR